MPVRISITYLILAFIFSPLNGSCGQLFEDTERNLRDSQNLALQRQDFVQKLEKIAEGRNFTGLEVVVADKMNRLESIAGHAFLRVTDDDGDAMNDLTIGFEMLVIQPGMELEKAFTGGWENSVAVYTFAEAISRYGRLEGRLLSRYIVPSSLETRKKLIEIIKSVIWVPDLVGDYNFFFNNCLKALFKVLSASGLIVEKATLSVPLLSQAILRHNFLIQYPPLQIETAQDLVDKILKEYAAVYNRESGCRFNLAAICGYEKDKHPYLKDSRFWRLIEQMSDIELQKLYFFWPSQWKTELMTMTLLVRRRIANPLKIEQLLKIQEVPARAYQFCPLEDSKCRSQRWEAALIVWTRKQILEIVSTYPTRYLSEIERATHLAPNSSREMRFKLNSLPVLDTILSAREFKNSTF